jgi:hypothetical protein
MIFMTDEKQTIAWDKVHLSYGVVSTSGRLELWVKMGNFGERPSLNSGRKNSE